MPIEAPAGVRTTEMFSQSSRWESLDTDRAAKLIRELDPDDVAAVAVELEQMQHLGTALEQEAVWLPAL